MALNEDELRALKDGMSRVGYKLKICPMSGFLQLFKKNIKFDAGYDQDNIKYLFIDTLHMEYIRKKKLFRDSHIQDDDGSGLHIVHFGKYIGEISNKPVGFKPLFTMYGTATRYNYIKYNASNASYQPLNIIDGHIILEGKNVWKLANGLLVQFKNNDGKTTLTEFNKTRDLIPTKIDIDKGIILALKMSVNPVNMITFVVDIWGMCFISKHKLIGFSRHSLRLDTGEDGKPDINDYWFIQNLTTGAKCGEIHLYNASTGEIADNIIFDDYETIDKERGEVYSSKGIAYPDSVYDTSLYKINIEYGESLYFIKDENDLIAYIPPQSNGRFTKPATRLVNYN